jgi:hypothetical protein
VKVSAGAPQAREKVRLTHDEGVFELAGPATTWIWVHTCPKPRCECRSALVLATNEGRDVLLERGAVVHEAWNAGIGYNEIGEKPDDLVVFHIDIDTAEVFAPDGDKPLVLADHPRIAAVAERIDGELLDSIGRLWYRGKGWLDPEEEALASTEIKIHGWRRGELLAWDDVCTGVRQDFYVLDKRLYEAADMYCPIPACNCGEVTISFECRRPRGAPPPGRVVVNRSGTIEVLPNKNDQDRLDRLWRAFQKRHPGYVARFARRYPTMKTIGARLVAVPATAAPKPGRNDPCPCGSGKKYKKCCYAASRS